MRPHHHHQTVYYTYQNQSYYVPPVRPNAPLEQAPPPPELVTFGAFSHCKDLANRLDLLANELCLDLHYNYPHNRGFKETYREAYAILQLAKFVQGSDLPSNRDKLRESLQGLDRQFHHVQVDVKGWSRIHARQIGSLGIIEKTDQLESIIHHLLYDVGIEPQHDGPHVTTPGVREEAPPPQ